MISASLTYYTVLTTPAATVAGTYYGAAEVNIGADGEDIDCDLEGGTQVEPSSIGVASDATSPTITTASA